MSIIFSSKRQVIVTQDLVLHLDAANPASYPGTGTVWNDLSGIGNTMTLQSNVSFNAQEGGGSIYFSGVANSWANSPLNVGSSCTVQLFGRFAVYNGKILFSLVSNGYGTSGPDIFISGGNWYLNVGDSGGNPFSSNPSINTSKFHHLTLVISQTANNGQLYLDGVLVGTALYRNPTTTGTGIKFYLARWGGSTTSYFPTAYYSIVRVYNRALTVQEIQQNYNATRGRFT